MAEHTQQREAFERYVAMGGRRSIERLHDQLRGEDPDGWPSLRTFYEWSRRFDWQLRLGEYERAASAAVDDERRQAYAAMQRRHIHEGLLLQQKGTEYLGRLPDERVSAIAAVRMLTEGVRLERSAEGSVAPPAATAESRDLQLEGLTDDELGRLIELVRTGLAGSEPPES